MLTTDFLGIGSNVDAGDIEVVVGVSYSVLEKGEEFITTYWGEWSKVNKCP